MEKRAFAGAARPTIDRNSPRDTWKRTTPVSAGTVRPPACVADSECPQLDGYLAWRTHSTTTPRLRSVPRLPAGLDGRRLATECERRHRRSSRIPSVGKLEGEGPTETIRVDRVTSRRATGRAKGLPRSNRGRQAPGLRRRTSTATCPFVIAMLRRSRSCVACRRVSARKKLITTDECDRDSDDLDLRRHQ